LNDVAAVNPHNFRVAGKSQVTHIKAHLTGINENSDNVFKYTPSQSLCNSFTTGLRKVFTFFLVLLDQECSQ